ncbi:hypothetical protein DFJ73DRAFT_798955 [Zopfochytrium polystomum]|nr:hypothetical protein DFJ73DRAFT_798955 [Zopfochytrium polystomum]
MSDSAATAAPARRTAATSTVAHRLGSLILACAASLLAVAALARADTIGNAQCEPAISAYFDKVVTPCTSGINGPRTTPPTSDQYNEAIACQCRSADLLPTLQAISDNCVHIDGTPVTVPGVLWPSVYTTERLQSACGSYLTITGTITSHTAPITVITPSYTSYSSSSITSATATAASVQSQSSSRSGAVQKHTAPAVAAAVAAALTSLALLCGVIALV